MRNGVWNALGPGRRCVHESLSFSLYDKHYGHCVFFIIVENFLLFLAGVPVFFIG